VDDDDWSEIVEVRENGVLYSSLLELPEVTIRHIHSYYLDVLLSAWGNSVYFEPLCGE
jgi:hypothetical protein